MKGFDSEYGIYVVGIIVVVCGNDIGMDGVVDNVWIMFICIVFLGDEWDKDVVNVIRYVVDNGVVVINMSFGKGEFLNKEVVDEVVKYVLKNDVLLVYGLGNDVKEVIFVNNFLNDWFDKKGLFVFRYVKNWLEVGVSIFFEDENLVVFFFNYSVDKVDVFVLGVEIYLMVFDDKYKNL